MPSRSLLQVLVLLCCVVRGLIDLEDWSRDLPVREKRSTDTLPSVFELMTGAAESSSAAVGRRSFTGNKLQFDSIYSFVYLIYLPFH